MYVPGAVEPMLPPELSNGACSLVPDQDRLAVTVEMVIQWLHKNTATAQAILLEAVPRVAKLTHAKAHEALKYAILTQKEHWPEATAKKLAVILG